MLLQQNQYEYLKENGLMSAAELRARAEWQAREDASWAEYEADDDDDDDDDDE